MSLTEAGLDLFALPLDENAVIQQRACRNAVRVLLMPVKSSTCCSSTREVEYA